MELHDTVSPLIMNGFTVLRNGMTQQDIDVRWQYRPPDPQDNPRLGPDLRQGEQPSTLAGRTHIVQSAKGEEGEIGNGSSETAWGSGDPAGNPAGDRVLSVEPPQTIDNHGARARRIIPA